MTKIHCPAENYTHHVFQQLTGIQTNALQYTILLRKNVEILEMNKHLIEIKLIWTDSRLVQHKDKQVKFIHLITVCLM